MKQVFYPNPDPNVFLLAARFIEDKDSSRCGDAIEKSFKQRYPNAVTKTYVAAHIEQMKKGFGNHPWFDGPTTQRNQQLRTQALYMMAALCKPAN